MDTSGIKNVFKLALRVGEILLANGASTGVVEAPMQRVTDMKSVQVVHNNGEA